MKTVRKFNIGVLVMPLRLQQVLIKPRKTAGVQKEGGREGCYPWLIPAGKLVSAHRAWRRTLHGGCVSGGQWAGGGPPRPVCDPSMAAAAATHRAGRTHPPGRVCLCARCAETNFPAGINQGQEAAPPLPPLFCFFVPWFN